MLTVFLLQWRSTWPGLEKDIGFLHLQHDGGPETEQWNPGEQQCVATAETTACHLAFSTVGAIAYFN